MILYYNIKTGNGEIYGSLSIASKELGLNLDALYYHFSRLKNDIYIENERGIVLLKRKVIRKPKGINKLIDIIKEI